MSSSAIRYNDKQRFYGQILEVILSQIKTLPKMQRQDIAEGIREKVMLAIAAANASRIADYSCNESSEMAKLARLHTTVSKIIDDKRCWKHEIVVKEIKGLSAQDNSYEIDDKIFADYSAHGSIHFLPANMDINSAEVKELIAAECQDTINKQKALLDTKQKDSKTTAKKLQIITDAQATTPTHHSTYESQRPLLTESTQTTTPNSRQRGSYGNLYSKDSPIHHGSPSRQSMSVESESKKRNQLVEAFNDNTSDKQESSGCSCSCWPFNLCR